MSECYHFIGIGGIGMSGLAALLLSRNLTVTGSDMSFNALIEALAEQGATIYKGHAAENISAGVNVVYTSDIKIDNPEYQAAIDKKCPLLHRSNLLAELIKDQQALAVVGTHGKTTTTSLLATVLIEAGIDPSFAIGGRLVACGSHATFGRGDHFVFEADESDRSFLNYHPFGAIVTNIDHDHLINYEGNFALLVENFKIFISQVQSSQHLFWCREDPHLIHLQVVGQSYGFHRESDWRISNVQQSGFKMSFDLTHHDQFYAQIELALVGNHNVLNAAAVFGLASTLGLSEARIRQSLKNFKGVLRRCEAKGTYQNIEFFDDYAHHPTEIQTTLQGIRKAIGKQRLIAIFQPHRYSRTQDCLGTYGTIFNEADVLFMTEIYSAGETPIPHVSHILILQEISQHSKIPCHYVARSTLSQALIQFLQPFDVVVTMGAGDITKLSHEVLSLLEKQSVSLVK